MKGQTGKRHLSRKVLMLWLVPVLVLMTVVFQPLAHFSWGKEEKTKANLNCILEKKQLSKYDYQVIYKQTGLGACAVDSLRRDANYRKKDILEFQEAMFCEGKIDCKKTSIVTKQDRFVRTDEKKTPIAPVETGDIMLSFSSHTLGWRHGHAGLVIDADSGLCLEAVVVGEDSDEEKLKDWKRYSSILILRLKDTSVDERKKIADFAAENLRGIPYGLTSGLFGEKAPTADEKLTAQCAYLVWYAFYHFGYDLDSDGGKLVTVKDIAQSPLVEVVQAFGQEALEVPWEQVNQSLE